MEEKQTTNFVRGETKQFKQLVGWKDIVPLPRLWAVHYITVELEGLEGLLPANPHCVLPNSLPSSARLGGVEQVNRQASIDSA